MFSEMNLLQFEYSPTNIPFPEFIRQWSLEVLAVIVFISNLWSHLAWGSFLRVVFFQKVTFVQETFNGNGTPIKGTPWPECLGIWVQTQQSVLFIIWVMFCVNCTYEFSCQAATLIACRFTRIMQILIHILPLQFELQGSLDFRGANLFWCFFLR